MIRRERYLSYFKPEARSEHWDQIVEHILKQEAHWKQRGLLSLSLFQLERYLCVYVEQETSQSGFDWSAPIADSLACWQTSQGLRKAALMPDVFHDGVPVDYHLWRGERVIEERVGALAFLKPEMVSSYVYYHYQMQEERPESFNKTYTIGLYGNILFSYAETPKSLHVIRPQRTLNTNHTPDHWHELMEPHFEPWQTAGGWNRTWCKMNHLITIE